MGFRYVGSDRLPMRLLEFDVELYFALTDSDVAAIIERFRKDALRPPDLGLRVFGLEVNWPGPVGRPRSMAWMHQDATESLTLDELLQHANCWLYERRILIPADRTLRDLGRSVWAEIECNTLALIRNVPLHATPMMRRFTAARRHRRGP
ncbi:hypothetical protein [Cupriavidus basilensis]|uniref:Uncharacterized protein n=1 Tax=Cupriavidus basilensis TaxID=68895 RepID=A0A7M2HC76_9BURK|nr:hypothetical protein [Cupriavidus basilensis]QOT82187.1 hypothetical protein F7R26_038055 [Cupriavidus basilensis]